MMTICGCLVSKWRMAVLCFFPSSHYDTPLHSIGGRLFYFQVSCLMNTQFIHLQPEKGGKKGDGDWAVWDWQRGNQKKWERINWCQRKRNGVKRGNKQCWGVCSGAVSSVLLDFVSPHEGLYSLESPHSNSQIKESGLFPLFFSHTPQGGTCLIVFWQMYFSSCPNHQTPHCF